MMVAHGVRYVTKQIRTQLISMLTLTGKRHTLDMQKTKEKGLKAGGLSDLLYST